MLGVIGSNTSQLQKMLAPVLTAGCCKGIDSREKKREKRKIRKSRTPLCEGTQAKWNLPSGCSFLLFENIKSLNELDYNKNKTVNLSLNLGISFRIAHLAWYTSPLKHLILHWVYT